MKNYIPFYAALSLGVIFSACSTTQKVADIQSLDGSWSIQSVDGAKVVVPEGLSVPSITFNTSDGSISGNLSCNRIVGSFDVKAKPGTLDLSALGSTRMMCHDMTLEDNILQAFAQVKGFELTPDSAVVLTNAENKGVVTLERMRRPVLSGEYSVIAVGDTIIGATDMVDDQPGVMTLDPAEGTFGCTTDCNTLMGNYKATETTIAFGDIAMTRMACPQAPVQDALVKYLPMVKKASTLANGNIGLYGDSDDLLIILQPAK